MIRLEVQLSTLSLVAFSAILVPLPPTALALYLAANTYSHDETAHLLQVAVIVTAVFLFAQMAGFLLTGLMLVSQTRMTLLLANGVPLLGVLITGLVWACARLGSTHAQAAGVPVETAFFVLWLLSLIASAMFTVYSIFQAHLFTHTRLTDEPLATSSYAGTLPGSHHHAHHSSADYRTPEKHLLAQYADQSSDTVYTRHYHRATDSNQTFVGSPAKSAHNYHSFMGSHSTPRQQQEPLKPMFKAHHQSDSATLGGSFMTHYHSPSSSAHHKLHQLMSSPGWAPDELESLGLPPIPQASTNSNSPMVLPKQRGNKPRIASASSTSALVSSKLRNFSNGLRKISRGAPLTLKRKTSQDHDDDSHKYGHIPDLTVTSTGYNSGSGADHNDELANSYMSFDAWEVNSASVRSKLLLSHTSRSSIRSRSHSGGRHPHDDHRRGSRATSAGSAAGSFNGAHFNDLINRAGFAATPALGLEPPPSVSDFDDGFSDDDSEDFDGHGGVVGLNGGGFKSHAFLGPMFESPSSAKTKVAANAGEYSSGRDDESTPTSLTSSFSFKHNDEGDNAFSRP